MGTVIRLYNFIKAVFKPFLLKISLVINESVTMLHFFFFFLNFLQNIQVFQLIIGIPFFFHFSLIFYLIICFGKTQKTKKCVFEMFHSLNFLFFLSLLLFFAIFLSLKFEFLFFSLKLQKSIILDRSKFDSFKDLNGLLRFRLFTPWINWPIEFTYRLIF